MNSGKLQEIIKDKGIKQLWLAGKLNVSRASVSKWVKGTQPIPQKRQIELEQILL